MSYSKKEVEKIMATELDYKDLSQFMHCKHCLSNFLDSPLHEEMTPRDYMSYEFGSLLFQYPDGTNANILAVFCKRCHRPVWDTRHLTHAF